MQGRVEEAGLAAHCRRVRAWALHLSRGQSAADRQRLAQAALLHHVPARLWWDAGLGEITEEAEMTQALAVLDAWRRPRQASDAGTARLAGILEEANQWDEQCELASWEGRRLVETLRDAPFRQALDMRDLVHAMDALPPFPTALLRLLRLLGDERAGLAEMERIAATDAVLAAQLLRAANSGLFGPRQEVSSIGQALLLLGAVEAQRVLLAACLQPLFASSALHALWRHSLDAAQWAEHLARRSGTTPPAEAYLAGLVHDLGELVIHRLSRNIAVPCARLREDGCPPLLAEAASLGWEHAQIGAELLARWRFPAPLVDAVRHHHEPEHATHPLASLLYLAEHGTSSAEDLPSLVRWRFALQTCGLSPSIFDVGAQRASISDANCTISNDTSAGGELINCSTAVR